MTHENKDIQIRAVAMVCNVIKHSKALAEKMLEKEVLQVLDVLVKLGEWIYQDMQLYQNLINWMFPPFRATGFEGSGTSPNGAGCGWKVEASREEYGSVWWRRRILKFNLF